MSYDPFPDFDPIFVIFINFLIFQVRWERKMGKKSRRLVFHGSRSSTSLDRSLLSASNNSRRHKGQKISFSRKFPFMKSRERLNRLDDDDEDMCSDLTDSTSIHR